MADNKLTIKINGDASDFDKSLSSITGSLKSFGGMLAGIAGAGAMGALLKSSIDTADELSKLSQKVGVNIEQLSAMNYAAGLADVSTEALAKGMAKLNKAMYDASGGSKEQVDTFKALGVSVTDSTGQLRKSDEVMMDIAERFSKMEDGAAKTALAMKVFGKSGADMIPLLNGGREEMQKATEEARRFGIVLTEEAGKQAEEFNDNLTRFKTVAGGLAMTLANELLPEINALVGKFAQGGDITGSGFIEGLHDVEAELMRFAQLADKAGGTMTALGMLLYGPGAALGNANSKKQFEKMADWNIMFEERYKDTEKALQTMANAEVGLDADGNPFKPKPKGGKPGGGGGGGSGGKGGKTAQEKADSFATDGPGFMNWRAEQEQLKEEAKWLSEANTAMYQEASDIYQLELQDQVSAAEKASQRYQFAVNDAAREAQRISDIYQEILMEQKAIFDASPWMGLEKGLKDYADSIQSLGESYAEFADNSMQRAEDAFIDFTTSGAASFTEMTESILRDLLRIQVQQQITGPLSSLLSGGIASMFGGGGYTGGLTFAAGTSTYNGAFDVPQYALGTNYVPKDGLAYLHEGEAVVPTEFNKPGGTGGMSISVGPINVEGNKRMASELRTEIEATVLNVIRRHS